MESCEILMFCRHQQIKELAERVAQDLGNVSGCIRRGHTNMSLKTNRSLRFDFVEFYLFIYLIVLLNGDILKQGVLFIKRQLWSPLDLVF